MQYLIIDQYLIFISDSGKKFPIKNVCTMAPKSVCILMISTKIGLYLLVKLTFPNDYLIIRPIIYS